jgi:hypothetical protein
MTNSFLFSGLFILLSAFGTKVISDWNGSDDLTKNDASAVVEPDRSTSEFRSAPTWGRHWHQSFFCNKPGIYCIRRLNEDGGGPTDLALDESSGNTEVELNGNLIRITTVSTNSNISPETMNQFVTRTVLVVNNQLPPTWLNPLLASVGLSSPNQIVTIRPAEQSYQVINTIGNNGEAVKVIQSVDRTRTVINGVVYKLLIVTTSGSGQGIPQAVDY